MKAWGSLIDAASGRTIVAHLAVADRPWSRLAGLQFRRPLASGWGLLLLPCTSIHTCFVRGSLDVLALDGSGTVLDVRHGLKPWRTAVFPRGTRAVVETAAGTLDARAGAQLRYVPAGVARGSLAFLR